MNLTSLFTGEEQIAGLQISDNSIKLALLKKPKQGNAKVNFVAEEHLPDHAVINGKLDNEKLFSMALGNLLKKTHHVKFVILTLSCDSVYTKILNFPKTISRQKLLESIKLHTDYQLPFVQKTAYADWQMYENKHDIEVLLAAIPKKIVDEYSIALAKVGIKIIAAEIYPLSLLRSIDYSLGSLLVRDETENNVYVYIFSDQRLKYQRTLSKQNLTKEALELELKRVVDFYESFNPKIEKNITLAQAQPLEPFHDQNNFLISIGAGVRGLIPRSKDKQLTLMPLRTETVYEFQRAIAVSSFVRALSIALSVVFILTYLASWFLIFNIQQQTTHQIAALNALPPAPETLGLQAKAAKIKALTELTYPLVNSTHQWSIIIGEVVNKTNPGITITGLNLTDQGSIGITGQATSRPVLNQFKNSLENSSYFSNVNLPLINLEQKANIPFAVSATVALNKLGLDASSK